MSFGVTPMRVTFHGCRRTTTAAVVLTAMTHGATDRARGRVGGQGTACDAALCADADQLLDWP
jgi:hypothetical protein